MALTKAIIEVDPRDFDEARGLPQTIEVQFNPTEYSLSKGAQIAEIAIPGIDSPILQFIRGQNETLALDLFFDTTAGGMGDDAIDVTTLTTPIYQLVKIQPRTHALPRVRFTWGQGLSFRAIVASVKQTFTLFNPRGVPLRATLSVSFKEYKTLEDQLAELNLLTSDHSKRHVVVQGDTLARIAAQEYDDPAEWRRIANANPQTHVRRLTPGSVLALPPIEGLGRSNVRRA
jgi:nucleoid-associated protein YgaU